MLYPDCPCSEVYQCFTDQDNVLDLINHVNNVSSFFSLPSPFTPSFRRSTAKLSVLKILTVATTLGKIVTDYNWTDQTEPGMTRRSSWPTSAHFSPAVTREISPAAAATVARPCVSRGSTQRPQLQRQPQPPLLPHLKEIMVIPCIKSES